MSATVCISTPLALQYPQGGGHLWASLNWALGLQELGCSVLWLEQLHPAGSPESDVRCCVDLLREYLRPHGLEDRLVLFPREGDRLPGWASALSLGLEEALDSDLLLNFHYGLPEEIVRGFRRSALVDIDPGLLQIWMSEGQVRPAEHDVYLTTSEVVGTPEARFPDCGLEWRHVPPPVSLSAWAPTPASAGDPYTTVSNWWGEWVLVGDEFYNNEKRDSFLRFLDLPRMTEVPLELALTLAKDDDSEVQELTSRGWLVRHAWSVSATPDDYRRYIQGSRGEFSCAKPSCMRLQNAWISDRTVCYLATGRPAVVQDTGPSRILPNGEGVFRFTSVREAAEAIEEVEADYERHAATARKLAEEIFDASKVASRVLELAG